MMPMRAPRCLGSAAIVERGLGRRLHEQVVDHALVLIGDVAQLGRQRVDDMEVADRQQLGLALGEPLARRRALALRAMPVAATVVGDDGVSARVVLATRDMAAERRRAAALDRAHHLQLVEADVPALASRQAGPWSRKMSATSRAGRATCRRYFAGGASLPCSSSLSCAAATAGRAGSRRLEIRPVATRV